MGLITGTAARHKMTINSLLRQLPLCLMGAAVLLLAPPAIKPAEAACNNPSATAGVMRYNSAQKVFQYCNDSVWVGVNKPGTGAGDCTLPNLKEGGIVYNADGRLLQGCAGGMHRAFSPPGGAAKWTKISASIKHACGIMNNGSLQCWGHNSNGQLGDGTLINNAVPRVMAGGHHWVDVAAGYTHSCGIRDNGSLWCWGERYGGKLGNGGVTTGNSLTPVQVSGIWKAVAAGEDATCAIKANDSLWCWGERSYGRLGDGGATTGNQTTPVQISGGGSWQKLSLAYGHGCAIKADNTAWCWGEAGYGRTGRASASNFENNIPKVIFAGADTWLDVEAGFNQTCGIKTNGTGWCWGLGTGGQLGDGSGSSNLSAVQLSGGGTWKSINSGDGVGCAVKSDDTLWCWGTNNWGGIGDGTLISRNAPVQVSGGGAWKSSSAGQVFTCGIRLNGERTCWGINGGEGSLGDGATEDALKPTPINPPTPWRYVTAGHKMACGIKTDDTLWCWGENAEGQLGINTTVNMPVPTQVAVGTTWKSVSASELFACGIRSDDTGWCWGRNTNGYLGDGTNGNSLVPVAIAGGGTWKSIVVGNVHSCGIKSDDTGHCWGSGANGRIGHNLTAASNAPAAIITTPNTWLSISAGGSHSCGVKLDKTLWCWGSGANGRIGNNNVTPGNNVVPIAVTGTTGPWKSVSAGIGAHNCALKEDDTLWCWGNNAVGQIGDGSILQRNEPVQITGLWSAVSPANSQTCGIVKTTNTLSCWGGNPNGVLGDNTLSNRLVPTPVFGGGSWAQIDTGYALTCGLGLGSQTIYCWGRNDLGQLTNTEYSAFYRHEPTAAPLCQSPKGRAGQLVYNSSAKIMQYCDGAGWGALGGTAPNKVALDSGLIAYWALDEAAGGTASDSVGGATGTLVGNPVWRPTGGRVGGALEFDGDGDTVYMGDLAVLEPEHVTVCVWAQRTGAGDGVGGQIMVDKQHWNVGGYLLALEPENTEAGWRVVSTGSGATHDIRALVTTSAWHHYCGSYDGTTTRLYVDGVLRNSKAASLVAANGAAFRLGSNGGANYWFHGLMDEVRVYNRALSLVEIQALANQ